MRRHFQEIKHLFFPRWDRDNRWRISTRSRRRVHGHCDPKRRVIEIVFQFSDPDERDKLLIHEISHAVAEMGHGKKWQRRMEKAARRADQLGRKRLGQLLREEVVGYRECGEGREQAYNSIEDWLICEPHLTLRQVKRALANDYGLLYGEVSRFLPRTEKVFWQAKRAALEERELRAKWLKEMSNDQ